MEKAHTTLRLAEAPEQAREKQLPLDARMLSSLIIKLKVEQAATAAPTDAHARLSELTRSASIKALLGAATTLANELGIPGESALRHIVSDVLELNNLWNQVLLKEGVARLTSQYH